MKLKMMERDGVMVLMVSGARQELVISEDGDGFTLELLEKGCNAAIPMFVLKDVQEENPAAVMILPDKEDAVHENAPEVTPEVALQAAPDDDLFKKLVQLRKELATADKVPPYLVFHDKTLHEMADKMPLDLQAMSQISGVGHAKLEKYGHAFLDAIKSVAAV